MLEREAAVAEQLGRLVMAARDLGDDFQRPNFARIVLDLRRLGLMVSAAELGLRMGVSKGSISDLMRERTEAGLDLLLRLATALAVPLPWLLMGPASTQDAALDVSAVHKPIVWAPRTKPRKDWTQLQIALELESASLKPQSLPRIARRVGVDAKHLSVTLPKQALALRGRHRAAATVSRNSSVHEVVRRLIAAGVLGLASKRAAAREIGIGRTRRCFQEAWSR